MYLKPVLLNWFKWKAKLEGSGQSVLDSKLLRFFSYQLGFTLGTTDVNSFLT